MMLRILALAAVLVLFTPPAAFADLEATLRSLDIRASADLGDFRAEVGTRIGASGAEVDLVFRSIDDPAHAAVCLWLARQSRQPVEVVVREYRRQRGGWGALAKSLGIQPGSAAFHALKRGDLGWRITEAEDKGNGKRKRNGKAKGKGRS